MSQSSVSSVRGRVNVQNRGLSLGRRFVTRTISEITKTGNVSQGYVTLNGQEYLVERVNRARTWTVVS